LIDVTRALMQG